VAGSCEHGNEPWGSLRGGEFLDRLSYLYTQNFTIIRSMVSRKVLNCSYYIVLSCGKHLKTRL